MENIKAYRKTPGPLFGRQMLLIIKIKEFLSNEGGSISFKNAEQNFDINKVAKNLIFQMEN